MRVIIVLILFVVGPLNALHIARFDLTELEWNGTIHQFTAKRSYEITFTDKSQPKIIDTILGHKIYVQFFFKPVYNDFGDKPGFHCVLFDSLDRNDDVDIKFIYKAGLYDAGGKVKDAKGLRRWAGKLKYYPDTSIHIAPNTWRRDNFTISVASFQAWKAVKSAKNGKVTGKELSKMYFEGQTGRPLAGKYAGKIGPDELELVVDPIRYQWDGEVWMEVVIRLFIKMPDGKKMEILAQAFDSRDRNVEYKNRQIRNAYEVRDADNIFYMLIQGIKILPY